MRVVFVLTSLPLASHQVSPKESLNMLDIALTQHSDQFAHQQGRWDAALWPPSGQQLRPSGKARRGPLGCLL